MLLDVFNKLEKVNIYSKDDSGVYLYVNSVQALCFQVSAPEDVIGRKDQELACQSGHAIRVIENDRYIIKEAQSQAFYETGPYNGKSHLYRSFKSPIMGRNGRVLGIHGMSIPVSESCLIPLTKQQIACLKFLARGCTHKQIALELGLSDKTVEHYLEAVKLKLNCKSRADLMMQAIERGLVSVL
jgi:DNA-binding CsgD family transcriptional regulator